MARVYVTFSSWPWVDLESVKASKATDERSKDSSSASDPSGYMQVRSLWRAQVILVP